MKGDIKAATAITKKPTFLFKNVNINLTQCVDNQRDAQFLINNFILPFFLALHVSNEVGS